MKVLTLHQPWASLVALGVKTIETRSWSTKYRGPLAIHAAVTQTWRQGARVGAWSCYRSDKNHGARMYPHKAHGVVPLPLGAIVATCTLVDVVPILDNRLRWHERPHPCIVNGPSRVAISKGEPESERLVHFTMDDRGLLDARDVVDQLPYGDFTPGRFAWLLADIVPVDPSVPFKGGQGLTKTWEP